MKVYNSLICTVTTKVFFISHVSTNSHDVPFTENDPVDCETVMQNRSAPAFGCTPIMFQNVPYQP